MQRVRVCLRLRRLRVGGVVRVAVAVAAVGIVVVAVAVAAVAVAAAVAAAVVVLNAKTEEQANISPPQRPGLWWW